MGHTRKNEKEKKRTICGSQEALHVSLDNF